MDTASFGEFIDSVPVCAETVSVMAVLRLIQDAPGALVVVIETDRRPLGIVSLRSLLPYWATHAPSFPTSDSPNLGESNQGLMPHQTLQTIVQTDRRIFEPFVTIPLHWTLADLRFYWMSMIELPSQPHWAVVDGSGHFVGLINQERLWKFMLKNAEEFASPGKNPPDSSPSSSSSSAPLLLNRFDPLIQLLERLPMPMMLQTGMGQVITQNLVWRQQLGELSDPGLIRREAAATLGAIALNTLDPSSPSPTNSSDNFPWHNLPGQDWLKVFSNNPTLIEDETSNEDTAVGSSCRPGLAPDTCVCICPMRNGQERVWQFSKVSLGTIDAQTIPMPGASLIPSLFPEHHNSASTSSPFHLATLGFSPDSFWGGGSNVSSGSSTKETLWLVVAQDITEQQQVAKELAAKNADLVQLNRLKDEFLACISHELKTPLTAVLGLSGLLKEQQLGPLNERQVRYAHLIHQSGRHLILIVNDILDLTRIETGQLELNLGSTLIEPLCQRAYEQAQHLLSAESTADFYEHPHPVEPKIKFTLTMQSGLETIVADEVRLRQMLANLLSNALKFTQAGGEIGLRVETWEGWIAFTVWDTGIGISPEKQHLIFQKFQQLENPLTRQFEGTGLGLFLTQRLARLHGGDVTFTSVQGEGSQFTLLLPPCPPQIRAEQLSVASNIGLPVSKKNPLTRHLSGNRFALVVESTPQYLDQLTEVLTGLGYRVAIARSGMDALEKIRRLQPTVVFLNPLLPTLTGWDVLTLLKADDETQHIPVIITATRTERNRAYSNHADGFLSLPIQKDSLERILEQLGHQLEESLPATPSGSLQSTVLHLHIGPNGSALPSLYTAYSDQGQASDQIDLNRVLAPHPFRILEVDDLDQAELLARVWKPDVILLDGQTSDPFTYMKQLSQCPFLASLPLVTLTSEITQAANQIPGLSIFPCLDPQLNPQTAHQTSGLNPVGASALFQAIQVASGMSWTPYILIVDLVTLVADSSPPSLPAPHPIPNFPIQGFSTGSDMAQHFKDWLQAAAQYIQTAGFRSSVSHSWADVVQLLQHQSVDLLLLCLRESKGYLTLTQALDHLEQTNPKPPILVWNCQPQGEHEDAERQQFKTQLRAIAQQILPSSCSMREVLDCINQILVR